MNGDVVLLAAEGRRGDEKEFACKSYKEEVVNTVNRSYQLTSPNKNKQFRMFGPGTFWSDALLCT